EPIHRETQRDKARQEPRTVFAGKIDTSELPSAGVLAQYCVSAMRMLFVADLHYALKQFDWLIANASKYDVVVIGGDLLELASALDIDVQIVVMEKYFERLRQITRLVVSSGNHDGNHR